MVVGAEDPVVLRLFCFWRYVVGYRVGDGVTNADERPCCQDYVEDPGTVTILAFGGNCPTTTRKVRALPENVLVWHWVFPENVN